MFGKHKRMLENSSRFNDRSDRAQALRHAIELHTKQGLELQAEAITATATTFYNYLVSR